jgi:hypothetical protein
MVLDIDSFLKEFMGEEKEEVKVEEDVKEEKFTLDFQQDVENKITSAVDKVKNAEFSFLENVYTEVKKFDRDLPNKFFGIEEKSGKALSQISKKYSDEYVNLLQSESTKFYSGFEQLYEMIANQIQGSDYFNALKNFEKYRNLVSKLPIDFFEKNNAIVNKYLLLESDLFTMLESHKKKFVFEKKLSLKNLTENLKTALKQDCVELKRAIDEISEDINTIPEFYKSDFLFEISVINKNINLANKELERKYQNVFNIKLKKIETEIESFHKYVMEKNLQKALMAYDNMVLFFSTLPNINLQKRIEVYKNINDLYSTLNKLVMKNNVALFMGTFHYSQLIEEIKGYLVHVKNSSTFSIDTLHSVKKKIESLPNRFRDEKLKLIADFKKVVELKKIENAKPPKPDLNSVEMDTKTPPKNQL